MKVRGRRRSRGKDGRGENQKRWWWQHHLRPFPSVSSSSFSFSSLPSLPPRGGSSFFLFLRAKLRGKFYFIVNKSGVMVSSCDTFVRVRWFIRVLFLWCSRIIICHLINTFFAYFSFNRTTGVVFKFFRVCTCSQYVYFFRAPYSRQSLIVCLLARLLVSLLFSSQITDPYAGCSGMVDSNNGFLSS